MGWSLSKSTACVWLGYTRTQLIFTQDAEGTKKETKSGKDEFSWVT